MQVLDQKFNLWFRTVFSRRVAAWKAAQEEASAMRRVELMTIIKASHEDVVRYAYNAVKHDIKKLVLDPCNVYPWKLIQAKRKSGAQKRNAAREVQERMSEEKRNSATEKSATDNSGCEKSAPPTPRSAQTQEAQKYQQRVRGK